MTTSSRAESLYEVLKIVALQEAKIKALVEALEAGPSLMHTYPDKSKCLCSQCEFIRLKNAAIAAIAAKE